MLTVSITSRCPPISTLFPYTTLFRSRARCCGARFRYRSRRLCRVRCTRPTLCSSQQCRNQIVRSESIADCCKGRSEEHTSELQSQSNLVCRLLLEKKNKTNNNRDTHT